MLVQKILLFLVLSSSLEYVTSWPAIKGGTRSASSDVTSRADLAALKDQAGEFELAAQKPQLAPIFPMLILRQQSSASEEEKLLLDSNINTNVKAQSKRPDFWFGFLDWQGMEAVKPILSPLQQTLGPYSQQITEQIISSIPMAEGLYDAYNQMGSQLSGIFNPALLAGLNLPGSSSGSSSSASASASGSTGSSNSSNSS